MTARCLRSARSADVGVAFLDETSSQIATYAGHKSLQTTMLYLHISGIELTEAVSRSLAGFEQWMAHILEGSRT